MTLRSLWLATIGHSILQTFLYVFIHSICIFKIYIKFKVSCQLSPWCCTHTHTHICASNQSCAPVHSPSSVGLWHSQGPQTRIFLKSTKSLPRATRKGFEELLRPPRKVNSRETLRVGGAPTFLGSPAVSPQPQPLSGSTTFSLQYLQIRIIYFPLKLFHKSKASLCSLNTRWRIKTPLWTIKLLVRTEPWEEWRWESRQPGGRAARRRRLGAGRTALSCPALCLKKGRRQGHCVCSMALLQFCSFLKPLTARGHEACFIVWVLSSLCVVNSTHLQRDRQGIVCLKKKKGRFFCFLSGSLQLGNSPHEEFLKKCCVIQK